MRWLTASRRVPFQAGTLSLLSRQTELLFVTLDKSEGYHDRIAYHDYAISAECFHRQSQTAQARTRLAVGATSKARPMDGSSSSS
ncbi:MAG: DUF3427 domain-containing protein [Burkholderiaceae bacterium]